MDMELYTIRTLSTLNLIYWKVKLSREDIENKHPKRTDLINSMKDTEKDLLEIVEALQVFSDEVRLCHKRMFALESMATKLTQEVKEIKELNQKLTEGL
jgi:hypothetical protein